MSLLERFEKKEKKKDHLKKFFKTKNFSSYINKNTLDKLLVKTAKRASREPHTLENIEKTAEFFGPSSYKNFRESPWTLCFLGCFYIFDKENRDFKKAFLVLNHIPSFSPIPLANYLLARMSENGLGTALHRESAAFFYNSLKQTDFFHQSSLSHLPLTEENIRFIFQKEGTPFFVEPSALEASLQIESPLAQVTLLCLFAFKEISHDKRTKEEPLIQEKLRPLLDSAHTKGFLPATYLFAKLVESKKDYRWGEKAWDLFNYLNAKGFFKIFPQEKF